MEVEGAKRVEISGFGDKRQFTAVFAGTLTGEFLPPQIIFTGKTTRCLPNYKFPKTWDITYTENHWANSETQITYVDNIILPFIKAKRKELGLPANAKALCIFDVFRAQMTEPFLEHLKKHDIAVVYVPACCTDRLQPMDLTVQKTVKSKLKNSFEDWYSEQIVNQIKKSGPDDIQPVQLSLSTMKELVSKWLVKMYQEIGNQPDLIINGFRAAGILKALEEFVPLTMTTRCSK